MMSAFITNKNNPIVTIVIGSVKIMRMGFIKKLSKPNTNAKIIAVENWLMWTPGAIHAATNAAKEVTNMRIRIFIVRILYEGKFFGGEEIITYEV